jgi:hypothetical protein
MRHCWPNGSNGEGLSLPPIFDTAIGALPPMAIYRLLQHSAFSPEDIGPIITAYEDCLRILKLTNRSDPFTEIVAKAIFAIAQTGVRDPLQLRKLALEQIGTPPAG